MKKLIFPIIILLLIASCKKYEEGPTFSLRSQTQRLTGKWKLIDVSTGNGSQAEIPDFTYEFNKDGSVIKYEVDSAVGNGTWEFYNKNESISMTKNWINYYYWIDSRGFYHYWSDDAYNGKSESWSIYELRNKRLKVLSLQGGISFELTFDKLK